MRVLETERLILRPWREDMADAEALYEYARDPRVGPMAGWQPHKDPEDSLNIIRTILGKEGTFAVLLKERGDDTPVGSVGFFDLTAPDAPKEPEIGYWIAVPYWGRGLIPEAVREVMRCCFEECGAPNVWCAHYSFNDKSRRVIEKCGFSFVREYEKYVPAMDETRRERYYRITKEEWLRWKAT